MTHLNRWPNHTKSAWNGGFSQSRCQFWILFRPKLSPWKLTWWNSETHQAKNIYPDLWVWDCAYIFASKTAFKKKTCFALLVETAFLKQNCTSKSHNPPALPFKYPLIPVTHVQSNSPTTQRPALMKCLQAPPWANGLSLHVCLRMSLECLPLSQLCLCLRRSIDPSFWCSTIPEDAGILEFPRITIVTLAMLVYC